MRIFLTGANGYIGKRLLPLLLEKGHRVTALVRLSSTQVPSAWQGQLELIEGDLLDPTLSEKTSASFDLAYYLVHSMADGGAQFMAKEERVVRAFIELAKKLQIEKVVYLSGIIEEGVLLSPHLASRLRVEELLLASPLPTVVLRASIVVGAGSGSFEIMRDLVEKLPVMVAPRWVTNRCQPIAIIDVLYYLEQLAQVEWQEDHRFDIGGPDQLSFKQMLQIMAEVRQLRRFILTVPVLTPRLSSLWLYFITSVNFSLARSLVGSMKHNTLCDSRYSIHSFLPHSCLPFRQAVQRAYGSIDRGVIASHWTDAWPSQDKALLEEYIALPEQGWLIDERAVSIPPANRQAVLDKLWSIGGANGWYFMDWSWHLRGAIDRLFGGVGLRRGRRHPTELQAGETLDFWRILVADREKGYLLLFAEMKLPGEAWLEFSLLESDEPVLLQRAIFHPKGLLGRLYWYGLLPLHCFLFAGMAQAIAQGSSTH